MHWLSDTMLGALMRDTLWAFPLAEILHFIGLCTLFGSLLVVDLRVLGLGSVPVASVLPFARLAMIGFVLNATSGIAFICSDPENYWINPAFRWKLLLVILGAANALLFEILQRRGRLFTGNMISPLAKAMAFFSIACWIVVIVLGRLLPYTGAGLG